MCQLHLFSTIALLDSPRSLKLLAKALTLNARLALLVETLEVRITQELVRESQLAWVVEHLPNIESLYLSMPYGVSWHQYSPQLQSALKTLTLSPKLSKL